MLIAILFALTVLSVGLAALRVLGLGRGHTGADIQLGVQIGLAPGVGLAALAIVSTWLGLLGAPAPVAGGVVLVMTLASLGVVVGERRAIGQLARGGIHEHRLALALLVAALLAPTLIMGVAFAGAQVPLSPHDGATHTETIQAFRLGHARVDNWYPPGMAALFGAWLQLVPWVDSAAGAFDLGLSFPLLSGLAVFGLGSAVWRDGRMAGAGAVLLGLTYLFPYFPEIWSGWPLALSLVLVISLWTIAIEYLDSARASWGGLAGLVLGALILVHGTELYTLALILPAVLIGGWRRVVWNDLARQAGVAVALGLACAAVYIPTLLGWAGGGGAYAAGLDYAQVLSSTAGSSVDTAQDRFVAYGLGALGIDLPIRVALLLVGAVRVMRQPRGRSVFWIGLVFAAGAAMFSFLIGHVALVDQLYAITFPWGIQYRMFMIVAIAQTLLAGAGSVVVGRSLAVWMRGPSAGRRRLRRLSGLLVVTWLGLTTWGMSLYLTDTTELVLGYNDDDAAAMAWLAQHVAPGEVLLNDGYADAGIWAPYKAGMPILLPRSEPLAPAELNARTLVLDNVMDLGTLPEAAAAACARHVAYVYHGAVASAWDQRRLPSLAVLRTSAALREVFSRGDAVVFQIDAVSATAECTQH